MTNVIEMNPPGWNGQPRGTPPSASPLSSGGGGSTYEGMGNLDLASRLSRLEGGASAFQWATAVVSTVLIGGMAVIVTMMMSQDNKFEAKFEGLGTKLDALESRVQALPGQINQNLMELNRTMLQAVSAGRDATPVIIAPQPIVPPPATTGDQVTPGQGKQFQQLPAPNVQPDGSVAPLFQPQQ